jgi:hypothetical protein
VVTELLALITRAHSTAWFESVNQRIEGDADPVRFAYAPRATGQQCERRTFLRSSSRPRRI